jgi:hypothetical protein
MQLTTAATARTRSTGRRGGRFGVPRRLVAALAVTQTVGYGVLYHAFSALLGPMSRDLGISTSIAHRVAARRLATCTAADRLPSEHVITGCGWLLP